MNEEGNIQIPRWVQIPFGIFLVPFTLLCLAGSLMLIFDPPEKNPALAIVIGSIMALVCCWGVAKGARLIFGWRSHGGLMGPVALRIIGVLFLLLPVVGLFTQHYSRFGVLGVFQAIAYVSIFVGLFRLAKSRTQQGAQQSAQEGRAEEPRAS